MSPLNTRPPSRHLTHHHHHTTVTSTAATFHIPLLDGQPFIRHSPVHEEEADCPLLTAPINHRPISASTNRTAAGASPAARVWFRLEKSIISIGFQTDINQEPELAYSTPTSWRYIVVLSAEVNNEPENDSYNLRTNRIPCSVHHWV